MIAMRSSVGAAMWLMMLACQRTAPLIASRQTLAGEGVVAVLEPGGSGCGRAAQRVGVWGPDWGTDGLVAAAGAIDGDVQWLVFPIQTGVGEAEAALRMQGEDVRLPLGARPGEFAIPLHATPLTDEALAAHADRAAAQRELIAESWRKGRFLLMDGEEVVGEIALRGEEPPMVSVHDITWLTPEPVVAARLDDGGDLLLEFPVEPALEDESGLLRVNVLSRQVSVPVGAVPSAMDRLLRLEPGALTEAERQRAVQAAIEQSDAMEAAWLREQLAILARQSRTAEGCRPIEEAGEAWAMVLAGYIARVVPEGEGCAVEVTPEIVQHRRRFSGRISP